MPVQVGGRAADGRPVPRSVSRALSAMLEAPDRAFDLAALAALAGASTRTLQRHFRSFLGKTPQAVLRDIRFERVRRDLLSASSAASVTGIAHRCGFAHLGRFSVEYRRRYGETPSETLRRRATLLAERPGRSSVAAACDRDHPTIAVIVETQRGDEGFGRSIADELSLALMRAGIAVTSGPERASYHLRCSLRGAGHDIRLTSRLIDRSTGRYLWAHCHDGTNDDAFQFEENAAAIIAVAMRPGLRAAEVERARRKPESDQTAHDLTMRALPYALALDTDGNKRSLDLLERAMARDPEHTLALAMAAWCHAQGVVYLFSDSPEQARALALALARRAISVGGDATALPIVANALALAGDVQGADVITRRALAVDGSSPWAWMRSGLIEICNQRPEAAVERLLIALDLRPDDPLAFNSLIGIGCARFSTGNYAQAAHWLEQAIAHHPSEVWMHFMLSPTYVLCGRKPEGRRSLAQLQRLYPEVTISRVTGGLTFWPQSFRDCVADGLETAGLRP